MTPSDPAGTRKERFQFGANWQSFLSVLNDARIAEAELSLKTMLDLETLAGNSFLDVGAGSGLFSLAAIRLNARRVHSFDNDPQSVACAQELKRRTVPSAGNWTIEVGNALDVDYLQSLGRWDIVYSWGVLHHTGRMWEAMENVAGLVDDSGIHFISIYNDQGLASRFWKQIKALYNTGRLGKWSVLAAFMPYFAVRGLIADVLYLRNPLLRYREYRKQRGMSMVHDWIDWLGGYPFEVAKPEQVLDFYREKGFVLEKLKTCGGGLGCNEFVFKKCHTEVRG